MFLYEILIFMLGIKDIVYKFGDIKIINSESAKKFGYDEKFIVEKSFDGENFGAIGEVAGNGATTEPQAYQFHDFHLVSFYNYYRLKQMDFDGDFEYSPIIFVSSEDGQLGNLTIFPNPVKNGQIVIPQLRNGASEVAIYDLSGKKNYKYQSVLVLITSILANFQMVFIFLN